MPTSEKGHPHYFILVTDHVIRLWEDLTELFILDCELTYFIDGSCLRNGSTYRTYFSASCILAKENIVTEYTDSKYALGVMYNFGLLWLKGVS